MRRFLLTLVAAVSVIAVAATVLVSTTVLGGRVSHVSLTSSPPMRAAVRPAERTRPMHVVKRYDNLPDIICAKKREVHHKPGRCERVAVLRASDRYRYDPMRQRTGEDNTFWCKDWSAANRGLYYVNWKEEAKGTFCWVEGPGFPDIYRNVWRCGYSSAIGYDVRVDDCWHQRRTGDTEAGWWISDYDKFRVSAAFRGFPLHWTYQFHVNLHPTGTITFKTD